MSWGCRYETEGELCTLQAKLETETGWRWTRNLCQPWRWSELWRIQEIYWSLLKKTYLMHIQSYILPESIWIQFVTEHRIISFCISLLYATFSNRMPHSNTSEIKLIIMKSTLYIRYFMFRCDLSRIKSKGPKHGFFSDYWWPSWSDIKPQRQWWSSSHRVGTFWQPYIQRQWWSSSHRVGTFWQPYIQRQWWSSSHRGRYILTTLHTYMKWTFLEQIACMLVYPTLGWSTIDRDTICIYWN